MNVFFVMPYPLHCSPSQRFRFEQYFGILENAGIRCYKQTFWDEKAWKNLYKPGRLFSKIAGFLRGVVRRSILPFKLRKADYIFIHRECMPVGPPLIEWIIAFILKKKIIYDFDDAIWLPNTSHENRIAAWIKWHRKVGSICQWSFKVSCGNEFLAAYAGKFSQRVVIIPTTIDTDHLHNPAEKKTGTTNKITIGWTGSHSTLKYLNDILPVLQQIEKKYHGRIQYVIIADKEPVLDLNFQFIPWNIQTEIHDLLQLDIGIMPLPDDVWSKGKCGFKALQYMALNIPAIISPVGVNVKIIQSGSNGFLAGSHPDWISKLSLLIDDHNLRYTLGKAGRETVVQQYSVKSQHQHYRNLFS